jgi:hypothetical protein
MSRKYILGSFWRVAYESFLVRVIVFSGRNDTWMKTESAPDLTVVIPVY